MIFSLPVHRKFCGIFYGDGGCEGERVDCVDGDGIFDTGGVFKISTQSSRPSRRGLDADQRDDATTVGSVVLVLDTVFVLQTGFVDIKVTGECVWFLLQSEKVNKIRGRANPGAGDYRIDFFKQRIWWSFANLSFHMIQVPV